MMHQNLALNPDDLMFMPLGGGESRTLFGVHIVIPELVDGEKDKFRPAVIELLESHLGDSFSLIDMALFDVCGLPEIPDGYDYYEYLDEAGYFCFRDLKSYIDWWEYKRK